MIAMRMEAVKQQFFDRAKVENAAQRAHLRNLARFGAFVRRRARSSLRKHKAVSKPGLPPSSHTGLIRDRIFFALEGMQNVVIGPILLNGTKGNGLALRALEHGGETFIERRGQRQKVMIAARPFMQPAFDLEIAKAPQLWENSIRG